MADSGRESTEQEQRPCASRGMSSGPAPAGQEPGPDRLSDYALREIMRTCSNPATTSQQKMRTILSFAAWYADGLCAAAITPEDLDDAMCTSRGLRHSYIAFATDRSSDMATSSSFSSSSL